MVLMLVPFCQIIIIFVSGCGKLDFDNDVLCVRIVFEEKNFEKKIISSNHVSFLAHHVKRKMYQINITYLYNFKEFDF